ncbi:MAG: DUF4268 domain-containing protein [Halobacteriovoraceae bacterium]|nr:DUF4268 domain-containing protein [Halobacteriovoraceae bacterium]
MTDSKDKLLGKLMPVDLRDYWEDEAQDFTPWLAEEENLGLLGETIGTGLELVGCEMSVGSFKIDILAKDSDSDKYVVIENQLEKTNHNHLGQLLTYASGYEAGIVIWIAKNIGEEHRKALDWLNEKTKEEVSFFGIEIELWQIEKSRPAPKFSLVSQPNDWAKNVSSGSSKNKEYSDTKLLQQEFWLGLIDYMKEKKTFLNMRKARPQHWYNIAVGRSHFHIALTLNSYQKRIGCELYIRAPESKPAFSLLSDKKDDIEKELNTKLEWQKLPNKGASRIVQYHNEDYTKKSNWDGLFKWLFERAEAFHKTFSKRVKLLDLED